MPVCPYCGSEVIEGDDNCSECQNSLADLHLPEPASDVERALLADRVSALEPKSPVAVSSDTSVGDVVKQMHDQQIGCMLVVDDGKLTGIFTERDALLKLGAEFNAKAADPVSHYMTPSPQTMAGNAKVAFAVQRMDLGGYRHLPVLDENSQPTGVVSVRDILKYLTANLS